MYSQRCSASAENYRWITCPKAQVPTLLCGLPKTRFHGIAVESVAIFTFAGGNHDGPAAAGAAITG